MQRATDDIGSSSSPDTWRNIMKVIVSALVALSFLTGAIVPASAAESFSIKHLDQDYRGGHGQS